MNFIFLSIKSSQDIFIDKNFLNYLFFSYTIQIYENFLFMTNKGLHWFRNFDYFHQAIYILVMCKMRNDKCQQLEQMYMRFGSFSSIILISFLYFLTQNVLIRRSKFMIDGKSFSFSFVPETQRQTHFKTIGIQMDQIKDSLSVLKFKSSKESSLP